MLRSVPLNRAVSLPRVAMLAAAALVPLAVAQAPLPRDVTYQGRVNMSGSPLNAAADFEFSLWDDPVAGNQVGMALVFGTLPVLDGLFTVDLDFGADAFNGESRWVQIAVASPPGGPLTVLQPRQPLSAAPYARQTRGLRVTEAGAVGIGTDAPVEELHVASNSAPAIRIANLGTGSAGLQLASADYEYEWRMKASDNLGLFDNGAGGAERLTIDTSGQFGIGVLQPQTPLSIQGNGGTSPVGITQNAVGGSATMELTTSDSSGNQASRMVLRGGSGGDTADIEFYTGAQGAEAQTMIIDGATGDVGIGTSNPSSKLDVDGTVTATAFVGDGSSLTGIDTADGHSLDAADGNPTDAVFVDNAGRVGMGTMTPADDLHIVSGSPEIILEGTGSAAAGVQFQNIDRAYSIRMTQGEKFVLRDLTAGNVDRLSIDPSGLVEIGSLTVLPTGEIGIGTNAPTTPLSIANGGNPVGITQGQLGSSAMELTTIDGFGGQATRVKINANTPAAQVEFYNGPRGGEWEFGRLFTEFDGGRIGLSTLAGVETVEIKAAETSTTGAEIRLRDAAGVTRIELDADFSGEGRIITDVIQINGGADIAEPFEVSGADPGAAEVIEPGMVVAIDAANPGALRLARGAYDRSVAGIISGAGGVKPGMTLQQAGTLADGKHPVALTGRVWCYVDADRGAVQPGELLTTSDTPGHAMKVSDPDRAHGAIIGKAMTALESGRGLVLVLVSLH